MSLTENIILESPDNPKINLRFIDRGDNDILWKWKNDNRQYFVIRWT